MYRIACCFALLGEREPALDWLARAFDLAYRDLEHAWTDDDLYSLRDDARFRETVAWIDASSLSRDEGWRFDLRLLTREVKRKAYDPFRQVSEEDFDAAVDKLSAVIPQLTDMQVIVKMRKLLRLLGDGHVLHRLIGCRKVNRRGRLFVIIGRATFSAAQNGASMIERHTEASFVGEPTGSSPNFVGETIPITLPYSKLEANVSDLYWQTSWPMDYRSWIAPTFEAFRQNRDPATEAILSSREHFPGW